jgi:crotonobetainyl-CoA:carnitine CoA-transferase CaiB-like acyl-CoA transferase
MAAPDYFQWTQQLFDPAGAFRKPEALRGIRVIDLGTIFLGPSTVSYLAELGAEAIKVELPGIGDPLRAIGPIYHRNMSLFMLSEPRNKHFLGLDVRKPRGAELFQRLAAKCDVLVENFRAGTLDEWGIGYRRLREINPRLIYSANNGFGQWGAFAESGRASYDAVAQAESGMAAITGFPGRPPLKSGGYVGDYLGAAVSAAVILAALHWRDRTGEGQFIEFSQTEQFLRSLDWTWLAHRLAGLKRAQHGNRDVAISPGDIVPCGDGMVAVCAPTDAAFAALCRAMGRAELVQDSRYADAVSRAREENAAALLEVVRAWAAGKTRAQIEALAAEHGFSAARVANARDHVEDPHWRARGQVVRTDDPLYGEVWNYGSPPKLSATPARVKWVGKPIGMDNEYVLRDILGLTTAEIKDLEAEGVIGKWADRPGQKPPDDWAGEGRAL